MKFSLIMPTLGRKLELELFLEALESLVVNEFTVELIIIDQNKPGYLDDIIGKYIDSQSFTLIHHRSNKLGLSYNRNIGLKIATGDVYAFPDDDCIYFSNTLQCVYNYFIENHNIGMVIGRIFDRVNQINIIKNWPKIPKKISSYNYYLYSSSITIFVRKNNLLFDELLGVGAEYGSCEDPDYIYSYIKEGNKIAYDPSIEVWHPIPDNNAIANSKVYQYARGFGYFSSKDVSCPKIYTFLLCIFYKCYQFVFKKSSFQKRYFNNFFLGLFSGFFNSKGRS